MTENEVGKVVVDCALAMHRKLGPGLLESVYELALAHEIGKLGLRLERQVPIPVRYDTLVFDEGFRADIIVEKLVIIELKSVEDVRLGYLINFGSGLLKDGITRVSNGAPDWRE